LQLVADWPAPAARLAERFWPGPLTLVLPRSAAIPDGVTAGGPTVAVRFPAHAVPRALIQASGVPIAAPSANRSTCLSPTRAEHVLQHLGGAVELLLDGGPTPGGLESTVLDVTAQPPRLLRPGLVSPAEIETVIGPIERLGALGPKPAAPLPSPGMLPRHYAPRAMLECTPDSGRARVEQLRGTGHRIGWLTYSQEIGPETPGVVVLVMPREPAAYSARLYAALHELDDAGVNQVVVELPPDSDDWLAVRDRLRRAMTPMER
jgi:L-threonylcarbamoyladenylate synthase